MSEPTHLVQFSTGLGSAEVAWRACEKYGPASVTLLTADTLAEDEDNWRFAREVQARLGCEWNILRDGRTPMQVGRDNRIVPNNRFAICSRELKRKLLRKHIDAIYVPTDVIISLGFDWSEPERIARAAPQWAPYRVEFPLAERPYVDKPDLLTTFRSRGIEPPRLYSQGFAHANCGGACVRGGQAQWKLLLDVNRPRYLEWEAEENTTRELLGKDVSILRDRRGGTVTPLTLSRFREQVDMQSALIDENDQGACGCFTDSDNSA